MINKSCLEWWTRYTQRDQRRKKQRMFQWRPGLVRDGACSEAEFIHAGKKSMEKYCEHQISWTDDKPKHLKEQKKGKRRRRWWKRKRKKKGKEEAEYVEERERGVSKRDRKRKKGNERGGRIKRRRWRRWMRSRKRRQLTEWIGFVTTHEPRVNSFYQN